MTGGTVARINAIVRRLREVALSLKDSAARIRKLNSSGTLTSQAGAMSGDYTPPSSVGVWHDLYVFGSCYGNYPVPIADVFIYGVRQDSTVSANYSYYLVGYYTLVDGYARVLAPDYPPIYDGNGNYLPNVVPLASILAPTYTMGVVGLSKDVSSVTGFLGPQSTPPITPPAVYVNGTGSGASINGQFQVVTPGSGYGLNTLVSVGGYYGTGWGVAPSIGYINSAFVNDFGSLDTTPGRYEVRAGGRDATIKGVVGTAHGLPSWNIIDGGACMGVDGLPVSFAIPAPAGFGAKRTPKVVGLVSGGTIASLRVDDPGLANAYAPGTTITGIATRSGAGANPMNVVFSGGSPVGIRCQPGFGYFLSPSVDRVIGASHVPTTIVGVTSAAGISGIATVRNPDTYVCFGNIGYPSKITGFLTSDFGSTLVFSGVQANGVSAIGTTHVAKGKVINTSTDPAGYYADPAYYPLSFYFTRDPSATIIYRLVFTSGVLTGAFIINPGYGYFGSPSLTLSTIFYGADDPPYLLPGSPATAAVIHFNLDGSGSATGISIDSPGSGYRQFGTGPLANGNYFPISAPNSPGATYLLNCCTGVQVADTDGLTRPNGFYGFTTGPGYAAVLPSSYSGNPLVASYDFTGTGLDGTVFQDGASRVVNYDGSL